MSKNCLEQENSKNSDHKITPIHKGFKRCFFWLHIRTYILSKQNKCIVNTKILYYDHIHFVKKLFLTHPSNKLLSVSFVLFIYTRKKLSNYLATNLYSQNSTFLITRCYMWFVHCITSTCKDQWSHQDQGHFVKIKSFTT